MARAAAASEIPLISAVGHETDTTLIDFAADRRAPTPTAAAEMAVPVRLDLLGWVREQDARLSRGVGLGIERRRQRLSDLARILPRPEALLSDPRQRLDRAEERLGQALGRMVERKRAELAEASGAIRPRLLTARIETEGRRLAPLAARLGPGLARTVRRQRDLFDALARMHQSLGYQATLARGYAVVRRGERVITSAAQATGALEIEFRDGRVAAEAKKAPKQEKLV